MDLHLYMHEKQVIFSHLKIFQPQKQTALFLFLFFWLWGLEIWFWGYEAYRGNHEP